MLRIDRRALPVAAARTGLNADLVAFPKVGVLAEREDRLGDSGTLGTRRNAAQAGRLFTVKRYLRLFLRKILLPPFIKGERVYAPPKRVVAMSAVRTLVLHRPPSLPMPAILHKAHMTVSDGG